MALQPTRNGVPPLPASRRLKMLRPVYLAQEQRVFAAAGLDHLLPKQENAEMDMGALLAAIKEKAADPQALEALRKALGI